MVKKDATLLQKLGAACYVLFFTAGFYSWIAYGTLLYSGNIYVRTLLAMCVSMPLLGMEGVSCPWTLLVYYRLTSQLLCPSPDTARTSGLVQAGRPLRQALHLHS